MHKTILACCASGAVLLIGLTACSNSSAPAAASGTPAATRATSASAAPAATPPASSAAAAPASPASPPSIAPSEAATVAATPTASSDPLVGTWTVDYGDPTVVYITESGGTYTITEGQGGTEPVGVSCDLPPGTKIATFSAAGPDTYSGQQGTWRRNGTNVDCSFTGWVKTTLKLSATQMPYSLVMPSTDSNDPLPVTFHKA